MLHVCSTIELKRSLEDKKHHRSPRIRFYRLSLYRSVSRRGKHPPCGDRHHNLIGMRGAQGLLPSLYLIYRAFGMHPSNWNLDTAPTSTFHLLALFRFWFVHGRPTLNSLHLQILKFLSLWSLTSPLKECIHTGLVLSSSHVRTYWLRS